MNFVENINKVATTLTQEFTATVSNVNNNLTDVITVSNNIDNINITSDSIDNVNIVANDIHNIDTVKNNIDSINRVYTSINNIDTISNNITEVDRVYDSIVAIDSLYSDRDSILSLYADKIKLDSIFNDKDKLDSIYLDKITLDSIYADKLKLDSLFNDKITLDRLYESIEAVDRINISISNLDIISNSINNIDTTAMSITDINTVSSNINNINIASNSIDNINTTANDIININTIATDINKLNRIYNSINYIDRLYTSVANLDRLDLSINNIDRVYNSISNVDTLSIHANNIDTIAESITNVNTVSADLYNIDIVSNNINSVNTVASNIANVQVLSNINADVTTVASIDSNVTDVANIESDVTIVSGISNEVSTVAGLASSIDYLYTNWDIKQDKEDQRLSTTNNVKFASMQLTGDTPTQGTFNWDSTEGTVDISLSSTVNLQLGQEEHVYGKATEGISNGQVVMFAGAQGSHILISKATSASMTNNPKYLVGVATQDISTNSFGYITWFGKVNNLNTSMWAEGTVLYFDHSVTGGLTSTIPVAPNAKIMVAAVLKSHGTQGVLMVRPSFGDKLEDLHNVNISSATSGDSLYYDGTKWNNIQAYTKTQTDSAITSAINDLIAGAPGALNTLNELATALGDDANFATTVTNALANKLDSSSYTAADILTKIKTVDGTGSGLDADLLDGNDSSYFATASNLSSHTSNTSNPHSVTATQVGLGNVTNVAQLPNSQTLTITGDVTASSTALNTGTIATTLANSGVTAGTYKSVTVDAKGRVTTGSNPTTLSGYGITDAAPIASPTFTGTVTAPNITYTGTLTGSTGVMNIGSGQIYKDASGNVGIGTSSPATTMDIKGSNNTTALRVTVPWSTSGQYVGFGLGDATFKSQLNGSQRDVYFDAGSTGGSYIFNASTNERMHIDSSGNVGIGVTPVGLDSRFKNVEIGASTSVSSIVASSTNLLTYLQHNSYVDSSGATKYKYSGGSNPASMYSQNNGTHSWSTAPSGTAGSNVTFTTAMTLGANGNLLVNTTTDNGVDKLQVNGTVSGTSFNSITALSSTTPLMDGTAAIGTSTTVARADHVHASDTSKIGTTNYASSDGTVGGTVKARLSGTTLYITTNGNNA